MMDIRLHPCHCSKQCFAKANTAMYRLPSFARVLLMVSSILHSIRKHVFALSSCHRSMSRMEWRNQEDEEWPKLVLFVIIKGCNHMISHDQIIHVWGRQPSNVLWHLELWRSPSPCHDAPALYKKGAYPERLLNRRAIWEQIFLTTYLQTRHHSFRRSSESETLLARQFDWSAPNFYTRPCSVPENSNGLLPKGEGGFDFGSS